MKNIFLKLGGALAAVALTVVAVNVNTTCMYIAHQPKLPNRAAKFKKY